ncbi:YibE/F family protein [Mycoplasma sp. P36-A1]|uniref:YibE/F family protein n=1 Tax=Mycoplasma sp. P36-A1 TaxID=3252900 RepID=UPI003C2F6ED4
MKKETIIKLITGVLAVIILFAAYKYTSKDMYFVPNDQDVNFVRAEVKEVKENNDSGVFFTFLDEDGKEQTGLMDRYAADKLGRVFAGDKVILNHGGTMYDNVNYSFYDFVRLPNFIIFVVVFLIAVIIYARFKGFNTVISLGFTLAALFLVFLPAVLSRMNVYLWCTLACLFIVIVTMIIVYGPSKKSLSAGIGIIAGLFVSALIMFATEGFLFLSGIGSEDMFFLSATLGEHQLDFKAITFSMIIIGSLGAVMDIGVSIAASIAELKETNPDMSTAQLIKSGNNIGKDINGTMVNTLILAYIGSSFINVITMLTYQTDIMVLINREEFILELFQPIVGSFGILATLPITSFVSATIMNSTNLSFRKKKKVKE